MLPVAISLIGLGGIDLRTSLFIGWFGPRGIASIIYLLMFVQYLGSEGYEVLIAAGIETIALSVILHGLTAAPLASAYGRWKQAHPDQLGPDGDAGRRTAWPACGLSSHSDAYRERAHDARR